MQLRQVAAFAVVEYDVPVTHEVQYVFTVVVHAVVKAVPGLHVLQTCGAETPVGQYPVVHVMTVEVVGSGQ